MKTVKKPTPGAVPGKAMRTGGRGTPTNVVAPQPKKGKAKTEARAAFVQAASRKLLERVLEGEGTPGFDVPSTPEWYHFLVGGPDSLAEILREFRDADIINPGDDQDHFKMALSGFVNNLTQALEDEPDKQLARRLLTAAESATNQDLETSEPQDVIYNIVEPFNQILKEMGLGPIPGYWGMVRGG